MLRTMLLTALLIVISTSVCCHAQAVDLTPTGTFSIYGGAAAATPPMGWNPWNAFRTKVDEGKIMANAEKIKRSGLADAGYRYINLDDGWWLKRGTDGRMVIRTSMFPSAAAGPGGLTSFRPLTNRLHAMGFKAGIYTDSGKNSCSQAWDPHSPNLPEGSMLERQVGLDGYEYQDLRLFFQQWGFDYVKVDACGLADYGMKNPYVAAGTYQEFKPEFTRGHPANSNLSEVETRYARIGRLIRLLKPKGNAIFSICVWGEADSRKWGSRYGNLWRTSADIGPTWKSMLHNFDSASTRAMYAGPGRWNNPDMLEIGHGDFDGKHLTEARTQFSLWSILSAPLLMGLDLNKAPQSILDILGNKEVIAVDQDRAGNQGVIAHDDGKIQILVKTLSERGARAVAVFNRGTEKANVAVTWQELKFKPGTQASVRDLWAHRELAPSVDKLMVSVAPRQTRMFKFTGKPIAGTGYFLSEMTGRINPAVDGVTTVNPDVTAASGGPRADFTPQGKPLSVAGHRQPYGIGIHADSRLEVLANREFSRFTAAVGVDDSSRDPGAEVVFRVYGDRKLLFESAPLKRGSPAAVIDVPVAGVNILELTAEETATTGHPVSVSWGNARLQ